MERLRFTVRIANCASNNEIVREQLIKEQFFHSKMWKSFRKDAF